MTVVHKIAEITQTTAGILTLKGLIKKYRRYFGGRLVYFTHVLLDNLTHTIIGLHWSKISSTYWSAVIFTLKTSVCVVGTVLDDFPLTLWFSHQACIIAKKFDLHLVHHRGSSFKRNREAKGKQYPFYNHPNASFTISC